MLRARVPALTECAERQVGDAPALAKRCYRLAVDLAQDAALEERLAAVREQIKEGEQLAEERRRQRAEKARQQRAKELLEEARAAIDASDYRRALNILEEVADLQPDNPEIGAMARDAWSMLSPQVEALVKLGDHLYLDEQLDAAVATWQAALNLKPGDEEIVARITRARTVLKRLDDLRHRQQLPAASPPG
jgi:tetratricopeptide (TPR) repeat protein